MAAPGDAAPKITPDRLRGLVGSRVDVEVAGGQRIVGEAFAFDDVCSMLVLRQQARHTFQKADYHLVAASTVTGVTVLGAAEPLGDLCVPSVAAVTARVEQAVQRGEERAKQLGVGVTAEAQIIFDTIVKTLRTRWQDKLIVVMDHIVVRDPYRPDDACVVLAKGADPAHHESTRQRVKVLVSKAWERIAGGGDTPASPIGK